MSSRESWHGAERDETLWWHGRFPAVCRRTNPAPDSIRGQARPQARQARGRIAFLASEAPRIQSSDPLSDQLRAVTQAHTQARLH